MSLIDLLLEQQLILLSLAMVLMPLVIVFGMMLVKFIRTIVILFNNRAQRRREDKAARTMQNASESRANALIDALIGDDYDYDDDELPIEEAVIQRVSADGAEEDGTAENSDGENTDGSAEQEGAPSGMQDILNSVFVDDEAEERVEVLLRDSQSISATDLAAFAKHVAEQLDTRVAS